MRFSSSSTSPNRRGPTEASATTVAVAAAGALALMTGDDCGPRLKWLTTFGSRLKKLTVSSLVARTTTQGGCPVTSSRKYLEYKNPGPARGQFASAPAAA